MTTSSYNGFPGRYRDVQQRILDVKWATGEWPRPSKCDVCGQTEGTLHGHLEDYSRPETYIPLCITCHLMLHCRFRMGRKIWDEYRWRVGTGWVAPQLQQRSAFTTLQYGIIAGVWPNGVQILDRPTDRYETFLDSLSLHRQETPPVIDWVPAIRL